MEIGERRRHKCVLLKASLLSFICLSVCNVQFAFAQQSITSATLSGRVEDVNKAAIVGASVEAANQETNRSVIATSDQDGRFRFALLPVGRYKLQIRHSGFVPLERDLSLTLGQSLDLPLTLTVPGVSANVDVQTDLPLIEKTGEGSRRGTRLQTSLKRFKGRNGNENVRDRPHLGRRPWARCESASGRIARSSRRRKAGNSDTTIRRTGSGECT